VHTPPEGGDPQDLGLADVLAMTAAADRPCPFWPEPPETGATQARPLEADEWVLPVPAFVGHPCAGHLHVEGRDGRRALLDDTDLRVLDAMGEQRCRVDDLAARRPELALDEVRRRLGLLVGLGRVHTVGPPELEPAPPTTPTWRLIARRLRAVAGRVKRSPASARARLARRRSADAGHLTVYAPYQAEYGPNLALGMLLAYARAYEGGALAQRYELRRTEDPTSFLADLEHRQGPAILLCSNYVWSIEHNLDLARRAKAVHPDLVVIHGGPSTPKYEADAEAFATLHGDVVDVLVRGEGEVTFAELLTRLADDPHDLDRLHDVDGLSYVGGDGRLARTPDRERVATLDQLPSPYLTGEYDHLPVSAFTSTLAVESNRGCPYGCTFCDWGSATLARIRKFDLDRVKAELTWAAERGIGEWTVTDANFGIIARDVDLSDHIAELRNRYGVPHFFGFTVAKNTTKHLARIVEVLARAGMSVQTSLSLQSRDEATLEAVDRANINPDHYVRLAAEFRRRNIPLQGDLMLGLPGQTPASYRDDLQYMLDHEITARTWLTQLLPNAPMNEPGYRERFAIQVSAEGVVVSTSSFDAAARDRMMRIRLVHNIFEHFGLLRHVLRFLQWEHGHEVMAVAERIDEVTREHPDRYPLLNWVVRWFDLYTIPPLGWGPFYAEVRRFVQDELGVTPDSALDAVLTLQHFLMPEFGRQYPATITLRHDYLAYYTEATEELLHSGAATTPRRPLAEYPTATFEIWGDPAGLGFWRMAPFDDSRDEWYVRPFWVGAIFELDSPLTRNLPETRLAGDWRSIDEREAPLAALRAEVDEPATPVSVGTARALSPPR
jgi:hypothetical protein